ncbi:MAG: Bacterial Ig-like domain (group 2), partial [Anaeromyxobacteraceae bacterium]|nr:Bacterial Ig-like domain (group 2) [Anaeromyxobacteraceae bacterium]
MPLVVGGSGNLTVTGTYSDATTVNLTAGSTFVSANLGAATVSDAGLVTAVGLGAAIVTATHTASGKIATATVSVTAGPVPVIESFTAAPASIVTGSSSTLSWTVSGATSLSIDQGVGAVTGTSTSVSPTATT